MIILEDLKPIIEPLLEGREDSAEVIEQIMSIDKEVESDQAQIDALNAEWQTKLDDAIAEAKQDKEESIKRIFFGEKADELTGDIPQDDTGAIEEISEGSDEEEITGENITIDDLFEEKIVE